MAISCFAKYETTLSTMPCQQSRTSILFVSIMCSGIHKVGASGALRTWDSADKAPAQQVGAGKTLPSPLRIRGQVTATIPKGAHDPRIVIPAQACQAAARST
jgi:hypothetical protein